MPQNRSRPVTLAVRILMADVIIPTMLLVIIMSAFGSGGLPPTSASARPAPGRNTWSLAGPPLAEGSRYWVKLKNPGKEDSTAQVSFRSGPGAVHSVYVEVRAQSEVSIDAAGYAEDPTVSADVRADRPIEAAIKSYAPPEPQDPGSKAASVARAQLGKPYVWGAAGPAAFDCSGLTQYCFATGAGVSLPRTSYMQANCGTAVGAADLRPGDILGFEGWGHVGIYIGQGQFVHAPHSGDVVKISSLAERNDLCGAKRI